MSDLIQFPGKKAPKEEVNQEQEELRKAAKELDQVNIQRKASLDGLRDRMRGLSENEKINAQNMSPASVEATRALISSMNHALTGLEAHDRIIDMITHDIIGAVQNLEALSVHTFQTSAVVQTILEALKNKGILTPEDLKASWEEIVKKRGGDKLTQE